MGGGFQQHHRRPRSLSGAHTAQAGRGCDDGDPCTTPDTRNAAGSCVAGPSSCPTCTDGDGDGYGDPAAAACVHPELDCDDASSAVHPGAAEVCNGVDDNCDATTDEGCACTPADSRACYAGPAGTENVGPCHAGTQSCPSGTWGSCDGQALPAAELCADAVDNDCDGLTDGLDLADCDDATAGPGPPGGLTAGCSCGTGGPRGWPCLAVLAAGSRIFPRRRRRD